MDWGVTETATTAALNTATGEVDESAAFDLQHSEHGKRSAARLARYQKMMARRKPAKGQPGSNGYKTAKRHAAAVHATPIDALRYLVTEAAAFGSAMHAAEKLGERYDLVRPVASQRLG